MTQEQIDELKAKYGKVFRLTINGEDWYYRAMNREEFKKYSEEQLQNADQLTQLDLEDMVFSMCNLNDVKKVGDLPAGVVATVADAVMRATGFTENVEPEEL